MKRCKAPEQNERLAMKIKIEYDGKHPNLCAGTPIITIDGKRWKFPKHCLNSGGKVWFDRHGMEHIAKGEWLIADWPKNFPEAYKEAVLNAVNDQIPHGCCGGCL